MPAYHKKYTTLVIPIHHNKYTTTLVVGSYYHPHYVMVTTPTILWQLPLLCYVIMLCYYVML